MQPFFTGRGKSGRREGRSETRRSGVPTDERDYKIKHGFEFDSKGLFSVLQKWSTGFFRFIFIVHFSSSSPNWTLSANTCRTVHCGRHEIHFLQLSLCMIYHVHPTRSPWAKYLAKETLLKIIMIVHLFPHDYRVWERRNKQIKTSAIRGGNCVDLHMRAWLWTDNLFSTTARSRGLISCCALMLWKQIMVLLNCKSNKRLRGDLFGILQQIEVNKVSKGFRCCQIDWTMSKES